MLQRGHWGVQQKLNMPCCNLTGDATNLLFFSCTLFWIVFLAVGQLKTLASEKGSSQSRQQQPVEATLATLSCVLIFIAICHQHKNNLLQVKEV